ncbi:conserved hypothetical protein [Arthrobacter sp. Hiyo6]|nr:conserved hypothetical protein [Arthrobacter sp. Hiyo6]
MEADTLAVALRAGERPKGWPLVRSTGYVVVELKVGKFKPEHLGLLNFQGAAVNDILRLPRQALTVGILVWGSRNDRTVRYAPDGSAQPLTFTSYTYEALLVDEQATLPSPAAITAALAHDPTSAVGA